MSAWLARPWPGGPPVLVMGDWNRDPLLEGMDALLRLGGWRDVGPPGEPACDSGPRMSRLDLVYANAAGSALVGDAWVDWGAGIAAHACVGVSLQLGKPGRVAWKPRVRAYAGPPGG